MLQTKSGKSGAADYRMTRLLRWSLCLFFLVISLPFPFVFIILFWAGGPTETAAIYFLLSFVSLGLGLVVGLLVLFILLFYRRRWQSRFRDRLAADGITAAEVPWFTSELSSEERKTWAELKRKNPLLADAYCETLAARLTASRIISRARGETLRVERQINRTRNIQGVDTTKLLADLLSDRQRSDDLRKEATIRLSETKSGLQTIEAAANRSLSQTETDVMLGRLAASQEHFPLALEMASLEEAALREIDTPPIGEKH